MNTNDISAFIATVNAEDLKTIASAVNKRWLELNASPITAPLQRPACNLPPRTQPTNFKAGDKVFASAGNKSVLGTIDRIKRTKAIIVCSTTGKRYNAPLAILKVPA